LQDTHITVLYPKVPVIALVGERKTEGNSIGTQLTQKMEIVHSHECRKYEKMNEIVEIAQLI
jgi:hypothetical protein